MRLALLGDDPAVLPLLRAVARSGEHALTHAVLLGELSGPVLAEVPQVQVVEDWTALLTAKIDAVIVGGVGEAIEETAKRLAAEGVSLIVFPRVEHGESLVYELSAIRDETGVTVFPALAWCGPLSRLQDYATGKPLHLRLERHIAPTGATASPLVAIEDVEQALLADMVALFQIGGAYNRVTAVHIGAVESGVAMATVTSSGEGLPDAVWMCQPATDGLVWRLVVTTDGGTREFCVGADAKKVSSDLVPGSAIEPNNGTPGDDVGAFLLGEAVKAIESRQHQPDWSELVRAYEMLDAVRRSLRRGRTIELHFEDTSERSRFKTQMTALGCGVLTLTFFGVLALLLVGAIFDNRTKAEKRAEQADAILYADEFQPGTALLTDQGRAHLDELARRLPETSLPVLIEQNSEHLDRQRRDAVVTHLEAAGIRQAETRVEVQPLAGPVFAAILRWARIVVFLPLVLFLLAQLLLFVARPARSES